MYISISGWKDADDSAAVCKSYIELLKAKEEAERLEKERKEAIARERAARIAARNEKIALIATPTVCAIIAIVLVLNNVIIPSVRYNNAVSLMDAEQYAEAIAAFKKLGGYKDSLDKAESARLEKKKYELKNAKVGDYVIFGHYEQDNDESNGKEEIEWRVLEVKDGKALVISKYALDGKEYSSDGSYICWENCTLRNWLNNDFINSAFSEEEKALIPTATVSADKNPEYDTDPGNATQDRVFLLSIPEANIYFTSDSARVCKPTAYAIANGAYKSDNGNFRWWLRSPGAYKGYVTYVFKDGGVMEYGNVVNTRPGAVRPALWIDLNF